MLFGIVIMIVVTAMAEAFLHYFPWRLVLNGSELPRPMAYILGTLAFLVPLSAWLIWFGYGLVTMVAWIAIGSAGCTVLLLYLFDFVIGLIWDKREFIQREKHGKEG